MEASSRALFFFKKKAFLKRDKGSFAFQNLSKSLIKQQDKIKIVITTYFLKSIYKKIFIVKREQIYESLPICHNFSKFFDIVCTFCVKNVPAKKDKCQVITKIHNCMKSI